MSGMTLTDFLLARIAEDEAMLHSVAPHGRQRGLSECEAKRRIINQRGGCSDYTLGLLALPYADHPDYREEWRP